MGGCVAFVEIFKFGRLPGIGAAGGKFGQGIVAGG
jgi:hypothetical protein